MTLRTVLLSLQALMAAAEPDDPQDAVVAKQYKENPDIFRKTAKHWSNIYAGCKNYTLIFKARIKLILGQIFFFWGGHQKRHLYYSPTVNVGTIFFF